MYHPKPECVLLYTYNLYRQMQIFLEVVLQMHNFSIRNTRSRFQIFHLYKKFGGFGGSHQFPSQRSIERTTQLINPLFIHKLVNFQRIYLFIVGKW